MWDHSAGLIVAGSESPVKSEKQPHPRRGSTTEPATSTPALCRRRRVKGFPEIQKILWDPSMGPKRIRTMNPFLVGGCNGSTSISKLGPILVGHRIYFV